MAPLDVSPPGVATLVDDAQDALDPRFSHLLDTVRLVLAVPFASVALFDARHEGRRGSGSHRSTSAALAALAAGADGPVIVADTRADPRCADLPAAVRSYLGVPFRSAGGLAGVLCLCDVRVRAFSAHDVAVAENFARCVASEVALYDRAMRDDLTGVMRRQPFVAALSEMIAGFGAHGTPAVLSILDLDHFKRVNDQYGHLAGDRVLRVVADACRTFAGPDALVARLGGEEFAIAFPATALAEALAPLARLRGSLARLRFAERPVLRVTASFGVAALGPSLATVSAWCKTADAALYTAKQAGRDQVRIGASASPEEAAAEARVAELARTAARDRMPAFAQAS